MLPGSWTGGTECTINDVEVPCSLAMGIAQAGAAVVEPSDLVVAWKKQLPPKIDSPLIPGKYAPFGSGEMPSGVAAMAMSYGGNGDGKIYPGGDFPDGSVNVKESLDEPIEWDPLKASGGFIVTQLFFSLQPTISTPLKPDSFRDSVEKTFDRVAKILDGGSDCAKFFGPHAKEALEAMRQKLQVIPKSGGPGGVNTGISQSGYSGGVDSIPSGPYRTPGTFTVYTNGPFFMQGNGKIARYDPGSPMAQNLAILHELAHNIKNATGDGFLIPNDGPGTKEGLSQQNSKLIEKTCSKEIFNAR